MIRLLFVLCLSGSLFATAYNVTFVTGMSYSYASGYHADSVLSSVEVIMNYNYASGGYAGLGHPFNSSWAAINARPYKKLLLDIKSDTECLDLFLVDGVGAKSKRYHIADLKGNQYKSIEINLDSFSGIDLAQLSKIEYAPIEYGVTKQIAIKNIALNTDLTTTTFNVLLVDRLVAQGYLTSGAYPSMANYKDQLKHIWMGYKYQFVEKYQGIVAPAVYGLVFDPITGTTPTHDAADYATSESSGYGLLLAVYMNDQTFFDQLLIKTWAIMVKTSGTGLLRWKVRADGTILDQNSATDADGDVAMALAMAEILVNKGVWTNTGNDYAGKAQTLMAQYYAKDLEYGRYIRLGDYYYGGRSKTNSSYFSPAWYRVFSMREKTQHNWTPLVDQGYTTLALNPGYNNGLAPDWCNSWGEQSVTDSYVMGSEAIRTYWRLALDALWFKDSRASAYLNKTKPLFSGFGGTKAMATVKFVNLAGVDTGSYTDISLVAMFASGALGAGDTSYQAAWKTVFDTYLSYAQCEKFSFFSSDYYPAGKYNYYAQSLGLLGGLLLSGALPNLAMDLVSVGSAPSLVASQVPARLHPQSINKVGLQLSSSVGGGYINTVDIKQSFANGDVQFSLSRAAYPSVSIVANPGGVVQEAAWEYTVSDLVMSVTLSYVMSCNWTQGSVSTLWNATDVKQNKYGSWQSLAGSSTFYPYPADYLSQTAVTINLATPNSTAPYAFFTLTNAIQLSAANVSWNVQIFTDQIVSTSGQAGMARRDASGNILQVLPLKVIITSNLITVGTTPDARWTDVFDRQDVTASILMKGSSPAALGAYYLYLAVDKQQARVGYYDARIFLKLNQGTVRRVDNFEYPDASLLSEFSTYWGSVSLNTGTQALISKQANGLIGSQVVSFSYLLGNMSGSTGPQALAFIDLRQNQQPADISGYKGIRFWIKAQTNVPLAMVLASSAVTDFDYYLYPIHPIAGSWLCYSLDFSRFQQAGFGSSVSWSAAMSTVKTIQLRTLSDRPGERQTVYLDEIELY